MNGPLHYRPMSQETADYGVAVSGYLGTAVGHSSDVFPIH
jgi:hypothetical protein